MSSNFEKVGRTAFVIAEWREEETESASPLFSDHVANIFLNQETHEVAKKIAKASPSTQFLVRYRTRFFDDLFLEQMRRGVRQFILLGAGLDTRSVRLGVEGVRFFEVEQEHVLAYKTEKLKEHHYSLENNAYVQADYTKVDLITKLKEQGYDPTQETFLLWEGNVFYLHYENILQVLNILREHLSSFQITFDYLSKKLIERSTGFSKSEDLLDGFGSIGAPWNTGIEKIQTVADEVQLKVKDDFLIADYVNERNDGFTVDRNLFDDYYICVLTNQDSNSLIGSTSSSNISKETKPKASPKPKTKPKTKPKAKPKAKPKN